MLIVRATRKPLGRLGPVTAGAGQRSTTLLGDGYATAWFWRPQAALLVSETTLLPVPMPLAPAATLPQRFGSQLAAVLAAHRTPAEFIDAELREMDQVRLARTASRSSRSADAADRGSGHGRCGGPAARESPVGR